MEFIEFSSRCKEIFAFNPTITQPNDEQIKKLFTLTQRMLEVNKSMNLTAITEENAVILKHYVDSVSISALIPENATVVDIGCGAGFPCLPLAIFRPDVHFTALDSTAKRIDYVRSTAELLELSNVTAIAGRAEEYANKQDFREKFDVATARAVAALPVLSELCLPFVKVNGNFIAMKASQGESEAEAAKNAINLCGGAPCVITKLCLTSNGTDNDERTVIKILKSASTPPKYPRHFSQISKKPL